MAIIKYITLGKLTIVIPENEWQKYNKGRKNGRVRKPPFCNNYPKNYHRQISLLDAKSKD